MTPDLDPRLEAAARRSLTQLYDAVEVGPAPSFDDIVHHRPAEHLPTDAAPVVDIGTVRSTPAGPRRALATVIAAAAALVAVALLVRELGVSDGDNDPAETTPRVPTHLLPGWLPAGFDEIDGVGSRLPLTEEDVGPGRVTVTVFGDTSLDDPLASGDLAILAVRDETIGWSGEPVTVGLQQGMTGDDPSNNDVGIAGGPGDVRWITWNETPEVEITVASRHFDQNVLEQLAPLVELDSQDRAQIVGLPSGGASGLLEELGVLEDVTFGGSPYVPDSAQGYQDIYTPQGDAATDGSWTVLMLSSAEDIGGDNLAAIRWMTGGRPVEVRGKPGWIVEHQDADNGDTVIVVWQETPTEINVAMALGIDVERTQHFVEELR